MVAAMTEGGYRHVQSGVIHIWLYIAGLAFASSGLVLVGDLTIPFAVIGAILVFTAACFHRMTVASDGDGLNISFGPIRLFRKRIAYRDIKAVERVKCNLFLDGIGVHYGPFRGWVYNISSGDLIKIVTENQIIRIGTDDADGLLNHLQERAGDSV